MKDLCKNPLLRRKGKKVYIINQHNISVGDKILITMDMSTPSTAGINTTFTGSLSIDWKEGGGIEAFTSGVEKTHLYTTPGTYIAEITGDLANITKFIADNSKITFIENMISGLLTEFNITSNLYAGTLDMSLAPISVSFNTRLNTSLTSVIFATSGNSTVTNFRLDSCDITGTLDLSSVNIGTTFFANGNSNLTGITFATSGNSKITNTNLSISNLTGTLDLSNVPVGGTFLFNNNANLTDITFSSSGNSVTAFTGNNCDLSTFDLSNVPITTTFIMYRNFNMTGITFSSSGNILVTNFQVWQCNLTGTIDCSNVPLGGSVRLGTNANLTLITLAASGNGAITSLFWSAGCNIPNIDFSVFPTSDGTNISLTSNSFSASEHDNQLINLDATGWINGVLAIITGNTARTAASDAAHANLLVNGWTIT